LRGRIAAKSFSNASVIAVSMSRPASTARLFATVRPWLKHWAHLAAPPETRTGRVKQTHYAAAMKTPVIPQVRVEPELRAPLDAVLADSETLSDFVEAAVRRGVEHRRGESAFHARGQAAFELDQRTGTSHTAEDAFDSLQAKPTIARRAATRCDARWWCRWERPTMSRCTTPGHHRRFCCSPCAISSKTITAEPS
jgi:hypothetical protein